MLLELSVNYVGGKRISTTSLCLAADTPIATGLRWIAMLERNGLIAKSEHPHDRRYSMIELSQKGYHMMRDAMAEWVPDEEG